MKRRGKYSSPSTQDPQAAGVCDRGGEVRQRSELIREMRWAGNRLVPTGFLCCIHHIDPPHPLDRTIVLQADPLPVRDPRPMLDPIDAAPPPVTPGLQLDHDFVLDASTLADEAGNAAPPPEVPDEPDPPPPGAPSSALDSFILDQSPLA